MLTRFILLVPLLFDFGCVSSGPQKKRLSTEQVRSLVDAKSRECLQLDTQGETRAAEGCWTELRGMGHDRSQFYNNSQVRRCLQLDMRQSEKASQSCWTRLLHKLDADRDFVSASQLTVLDVAKIRKKAERSTGRLVGLRNRWDRCFKMPAGKREQRIACLKDYLKRNASRLSAEEFFEAKEAVRVLIQAGQRVAGEIENTVEHAGKLLGARLILEEEGVRIDQIAGDGLLAQAQGPEQGIIVAIDGVAIVEYDEHERIARLEACQDKPVTLLIRQGEIQEVIFTRVKCGCGVNAKGLRISQTRLPVQICSSADSIELRLGISWCYMTRDGVLEVEDVFIGSPANRAGVQGRHQYVSINGKSILGLSYQQISQWLRTQLEKGKKVAFSSRKGLLESPQPLTGPLLDATQVRRFWEAFKSTLDASVR
jgi:hypothetical protein